MMHRRRKNRFALNTALFVGAAAGLVWAGSIGRPVGNRRVPAPTKPVDLDQYVGRWFEFARYDNRFERGCEGVTAEYHRLPDGLIQVVNTCRQGSPDGRSRSARGRAKIVPGSGSAKLKVSFFGPLFIGNYWVMDRAEDYSWSIVGENSGRYLWILTRAAVPDTDTQTALVRRTAELGYDTGMLRYTRHA